MKMHTIEAEEPLAADTWGCMDFNLADMDDIWSFEKFPFSQILKEFPLDDFLGGAEFDDAFDLAPAEPKEIVHHDCMWSGKCKDKSHPGNATATPPPLAPIVSPAPVLPPEPLPIVQAQVESVPIVAPAPATPGRSLLIRSPSPVVEKIEKIVIKRRTIVAPSPPVSPRPDTPQSLDDEEEDRVNDDDDDEDDVVVPGRVYDVESEEEYDEEDEGYEGYEEEELRHLYSGPARNNAVACDHSYTRKNSKQARIDLLGVQTPSDSEEEIDVVSLGEKSVVVDQKSRPAALPTNPSPSTRRYLAHAIAAVDSRQPQPQPRKRPRERSVSPLPRHHRKRTKAAAKPRYQPSKRRPYSSNNSDSEAENIERRSLHNDMERMRRIGLKNLFDELKTEVPTIRHKERAPKVVVLREAAVFCEKLQREEREMEQLKAKQQRLLARVRQLRVELAQRRPKNA